MSKYILLLLFAPLLATAQGSYRHFNTSDSVHSFPVEYISVDETRLTQLCHLQNVFTPNLNYFLRYQMYNPNCINSQHYNVQLLQNHNIK